MTEWNKFFKEKITKIFKEKEQIIDIGGGLRIDKNKNNRFNKNNLFITKLIKNKRQYLILDKVSDYNSDIVGDIHNLPFEDNSVESIICIAVLEHVEKPWQAIDEMYRVLKPGGYLYIYVPFLYYYHPMKGYYKDYYRFTKNGLKYLLKDFSHLELQNVRGALHTVFNLVPFINKYLGNFFIILDILFRKDKSDQTSGYNVFCIK